MDQQLTEQTTPKYQPKTLAAIKMVNNQVDPYTALQLVNNKDKISAAAVCKLKKKVNKYSLTHPKLVKAAKNQVERILSGETREIEQQKVTKDGQVVDYIETIAPSDTNILAAAALVYDRYEPVIKQGLQINVDISAINLDSYRNKVACDMHSDLSADVQAIDITRD